MSFFQGIFLGIIQGLTEFLPVSSSGHLVIAQKLISFGSNPMAFDAILHLGTLAAVVTYFWRELVLMAGSVWRWLRWRQKDKNLALVGYLLLASLPAAGAGALFEGLIGSTFESTLIVGIMLIVTGIILWLAESLPEGTKTLDSLKFSDSIWVGLAQMVAIVPGLSRSGSTISAGMWRGFKREEAAKFSFLLAIPIIIGAAAISFENGFSVSSKTTVLAAILAAALSGYLAIAVLLKIIQEQRLRLFAVYCFIMGSVALALSLT